MECVYEIPSPRCWNEDGPKRPTMAQIRQKLTKLSEVSTTPLPQMYGHVHGLYDVGSTPLVLFSGTLPACVYIQ